MSLDYRVLGPIEVWADGRPLDIGGARQRRLIAALVVADGRPVAADRLVEIVWAGDPPNRARNTLRTYIARARRIFEVGGGAPLLTEANGWCLERDAGDLDSTRFESLLDAGRAMSVDPLAALAVLEDASALWRGGAFEEFADEDWFAGEATRLDELRVVADEARIDAKLACGLHDDAIGELEGLIEKHPLRDRPRAQLMVALYRAGRQVEALRRFQDYRRFLDDEVGVDVADELRTLEQRIISRDPTLRQLPAAGRRLRGYELGPELGEGALGRTHRASQAALGREVAIKVIRPEFADDPGFIRRFEAEAQLVARLEHPHIVPLLDYWREPGGAYLVMRYLKGGTAAQLIEATGPLPPERVSQIVDEVGSALATAHAAGVIHRDVSTANIFFDEHGRAYLGGFGIATMAGSAGVVLADSPAAADGASPEHAASVESDVCALGSVIFELLTGRVRCPRGLPLPERMEQQRRASTPRLIDVRPELPQALDDAITRATTPDPTERFRDISEFVLAVRAATAGTRGYRAPPLGLAVRNPYKGLAAFGEVDAADFFGRDHATVQLCDHLARSRFVVAVGPSGAGKSSVVRAGLTPRLRAAGAFVTTMVPGLRPGEALTEALLRVAPEVQVPRLRLALARSDPSLAEAAARCLPDASGELVLIIDQFEELFTISDPDERDELLDLLADAVTQEAGRVRVIATLRADFYDRPLNDRRIGALTQANTIAVAPLSPAELERAITGPAERVGVSLEPGLVAAIVSDAAGESATLPLVQFLLTGLFEHRTGDSLTIAAYERLGGLGGAVARRADEIFEGYDESGRDESRRLFNRLVAPGDGGYDTRRRVRVSELPTIAPGVVADYGAARLLTFDHDPTTREPTVEIAHESLIRQWPRLRRWVERDREGLETLRQVSRSAAAWEAVGRDPAELSRGARLLAAEEWAVDHDAELNSSEQAFLEASRRARDVDRMRERRRLRRLRVLVTSLAVVVVMAVVAGLIAFRQRQAADASAAEAERRALENRSAQLVSEASLATARSDPDLAILLALAAHDVSAELSETPQPGVVAALHEAVHASRLERVIPVGNTEIAISPDGRLVALDHLRVDETSRLSVYDIETGELVVERRLDEPIGGLAYSPDGSVLAVAFFPPDRDRGPDVPAMILLDSATLGIVQRLDGGLHTFGPSWSADGTTVMAVGFAGARVWSVDRPEVQRTFGDATSATFVPGTNDLAVVSPGAFEIIDRETGEVQERVDLPGPVDRMSVSSGGELAALADISGRSVQVIDVASGQPTATIAAPSLQDVRFSPNGELLSIAGNDDIVRVVTLESGATLELRGHGTGSWKHAYTPDGDRLLAVGIDGWTRVWNLEPGGPPALGNLTIDGIASGATPISDSELLVAVRAGSTDATIELIDTADNTGRTVAEFWYRPFDWPVFSMDGSLVAGFSRVGILPSVVDAETGEEVLALRACEAPRAVDPLNGWVLVEAFSCPDESQDPRESDSRTGFIDLDTGVLLASVAPDGVFDALPGPSGSVAADLLVYRTQTSVVFMRSSSREVVTEWSVPPGIIPLSNAFSPDGTQLGIAAQSREGIFFDIEAILAGAPAGDAVTVVEEMTTGPTQRVVPVGDLVVSSGGGTQIRQWDAATGSLMVEVATDVDGFANLFAMPDGSTLYYQDADGVLRRFVTDVDELVRLARSRVQRGFTVAECERYFVLNGCTDERRDGDGPDA